MAQWKCNWYMCSVYDALYVLIVNLIWKVTTMSPTTSSKIRVLFSIWMHTCTRNSCGHLDRLVRAESYSIPWKMLGKHKTIKHTTATKEKKKKVASAYWWIPTQYKLCQSNKLNLLRGEMFSPSIQFRNDLMAVSFPNSQCKRAHTAQAQSQYTTITPDTPRIAAETMAHEHFS